MGFSVRLCHNSSPVEKIGKSLDAGLTIDNCVLKAATSILKPVILLLSDNAEVTTFNYMHIEALGRYYFIDDIVSINNNKWEISAHVDVLETYKGDILANDAILENSEEQAVNMYLYDPDIFKVNCKHKTDIIPFANGLLDTGEFILITAGG